MALIKGYGIAKSIGKAATRVHNRLSRKYGGKQNAAYRKEQKRLMERAARRLTRRKAAATHRDDFDNIFQDPKFLRQAINKGGHVSDKRSLNRLFSEAMLTNDKRAIREIKSAMFRRQRDRMKHNMSLDGFAVKASKKQLALWSKQLR